MNTPPTRTATGRRAIVVAVVLIGLAMVLALATTSPAPDTQGSSYGSGISISGTPLARMEAGADPALGQPAPRVATRSVDGTEATLASGGGPQVIAFLAHWCSHCRAEVPVVVRWLDGGGLAEGVDLIAVATATDPGQPNFPPQAWLDREGWRQPVILDDEASAIAAAYGVSGFPFWVVLDGDGRVVARASGELDPQQLDQLVAAATTG